MKLAKIQISQVLENKIFSMYGLHGVCSLHGLHFGATNPFSSIESCCFCWLETRGKLTITKFPIVHVRSVKFCHMKHVHAIKFFKLYIFGESCTWIMMFPPFFHYKNYRRKRQVKPKLSSFETTPFSLCFANCKLKLQINKLVMSIVNIMLFDNE